VHDIERKRILILGEFGAFGQHVARALARLPGAELVLGAREPQQLGELAQALGARALAADPGDEQLLRGALAGAFAVVNTFGPFRADNYGVATVCAELGVHYLDPADAREHVAGIERLDRRARASGASIVSGAGAVPAVSAALAELAFDDFERVGEIHTFVAPGRSDRRELATAYAILGFMDEVRIKERGRWQRVPGWRRVQAVTLPEPLGRRRGYLCDLPDVDLFPRRFGAQTVTARVATPSALFSAGVAVAGWLKRRGMLRDLTRPVRWLLRVSPAFAGSGARQPGAALRVEVRGQHQGRPAAQTLTLLARHDSGHAISAAPIAALVRRWLAQGGGEGGATPCVGLLDWDDIRAELLADGAEVVLIRAWEERDDRAAVAE
jgi:saccharopine dehydrogenase-like NADP-dependent oxidoreductase